MNSRRSIEISSVKSIGAERSGLDAILEGKLTDNPEIRRGVFLIGQRTSRMVDLIADLRKLEAEGRMTIPISQVAVSMLHMWVNRMLPSVQRAQEMVLYDFLTRHYESKHARSAKRGRSSLPLSAVE